ncbi:unnamed protein product [Cochlearia groenlandica]
MDQPKKVADSYLKREVLDQGTYGVVFKATDTKLLGFLSKERRNGGDQEEIRLGKEKEGVIITALREIKLLKEIKHPHIIELIDAFPHKENLHLVFEFMETDLEAVLRDPNLFLSPADVKSYLQMTLKGLEYCHEKWVLHRDMKPNNLLIGPNGQLKLADFGLARIFGSPSPKFTHHVFARWYRAPELLFGAKQYGDDVDVWAAGCVFDELLLRRPFLQFSLAPSLRSLFPTVSEDALDLLSKMFTYDPKSRISIHEALHHRYFTCATSPTDPSKLPRPVRKQDAKSSA